ncbi:MAG: PaaI family thioesterase [Proteobacteria bacterium]|nr:PaaI family thioesterase [Pseudomonadota bacterium]MCH8950771.1 PaaI family thioesterase [Pseudomonadota bacterium]
MSEPTFEPRDPDFEARVRASFARQNFMELLGARLLSVAPGAVEIELPLRRELEQQHGFAHAGAAWSIADSAAGYASQSLMAPGEGVLTVELKINLLAPARGERLIARGRVERAGRRLTVARADVYAVTGGGETHVATALGTFMTMSGLADGT